MDSAPVLHHLRLHDGASRLAARRALRGPCRAGEETGVWSRVREQAAARPGDVAVVTRTGTVSHHQLARRVRQVQAVLLAHGCRPRDAIAVVGSRCVDTIAAFLAIEGIGAAYLPVDPGWPGQRLRAMLTRTAARCLLVLDDGGPVPAAVRQAATRAGVAVAPAPAPDAAPAPPLAARVAADDEPRYVLHTSGSTGLPKCAVVEQLGLMNHLSSIAAAVGLNPADRVAFSAPPIHVISIWQMVAALLAGGSVAVVDEADTRFPPRLVTFLERSGVTVLELVPTMLGWLLDQVSRRPRRAALPDLRCLISTGEPLPPGLAARVPPALPRVELFNAYGATECSDDIALYRVGGPVATRSWMPVGSPVPNTALYLLVEQDGAWRAAEPGEVGELWVGGHPVGGGYLNDPELTRASFFVDEFDPASRTGRLYRTGDLAIFDGGLVHCLGRADRQVKVGGVRIELDEVEGALMRTPGLMQCAVLAETDRGRPQLAVYYTAKAETAQQDLYASVRESLPAALFPRRWISLVALPHNRSGKVDYAALAALGGSVQ